MPRELVMNELSLAPACDSKAKAMAWMARFLTLLDAIKIHSRTTRLSLRTSISIDEWQLGPDYSIQQWRYDRSVDIELRRKFLAVDCNWPAIIEHAEPELMTRQLGSEYLFNGQEAVGLGLAWLLDGLAISFDQPPWGEATVPLTERTLGPEATIEQQPVVVRHASQAGHADTHKAWLRPSVVVLDGADLWSRRSTLFPQLSFCARVEHQLRALDRGHPLLDQVIARLQRLNEYVTGWTAGPPDIRSIGIKITPESEATLSAYAGEHTFLCPDGEERLFSWHARMTPDAWRLFFFPIRPGELVIGHIGAKLPNVSY